MDCVGLGSRCGGRRRTASRVPETAADRPMSSGTCVAPRAPRGARGAFGEWIVLKRSSEQRMEESSPTSGSGAGGRPLYLEEYPSFNDFEQMALRDIVRRLRGNDLRVLEIGSWLGSGSTLVFINELKDKNAHLYCVDTWQGSPNVQRHLEIAQNFDVFGIFVHNVQDNLQGGLVNVLMMTSDRAAELVGDASLDLVFIDGDHSYEQTLRDIRNWLPKVRPGAFCAVTTARSGSPKKTKRSSTPIATRTASSRLVRFSWSIILASSSRFMRSLGAGPACGPSRRCASIAVRKADRLSGRSTSSGPLARLALL